MNVWGFRSGNEDVRLDVGAAALNALSEQQANRFLALTREDVEIATELEGFRETAALLAAVTAEAPPARMRVAVLERIAEVRQLPPAVDEETVAPDVGWRRHLRPVLAAAAAVALIAAATIALTGGDEAQDQVALADCVAGAADLSTFQGTTDSVGISSVEMAPSCGAATIHMSGLPDLPAGQQYQVWAIAGDHTRSLGLMELDEQGSAPAMTAPMGAADDMIGVSVEPIGGSDAPTSTPVVIIPLTP